MAEFISGNIAEIVEKLLKKFPVLRDNDKRLIASVWVNQLGGKSQVKKMTAEQMLNAVVNGVCSTPESITRARRALQEAEPLLRGSTYVERQEKQEQVLEEVREIQTTLF